MKKLYILLVLVMTGSISVKAQFIGENKRVLDGSIGLGFSISNDSTDNGNNRLKSSSFFINLSPSFGKAIRNDLVFGYYTSGGVNAARNEDRQKVQEFKSSGYQVGGGIFWEKFFSLNNKFAFSGRLSTGTGYSFFRSRGFTNAVEGNTIKTTNFHAGVSLAPLLNYKLNNKFLLALYANDFVGISFIKGTTETQGPNITTVKSKHTNFSASSILNYSKSLQNLGFSFRYIF